ncbi:PREDICTED: uncharacterized protein LOC105448374 [Wasmannia auropunctata]|uniref:uncharacterized protein LOC105448374 n=1 Tax=Wasmannia auropunctata TaxID=64793 RepID=UPI0005ED70ED|nr:PREDICTED: uncharacterized protein LOC105448374 [Wasmannia auropunctata]
MIDKRLQAYRIYQRFIRIMLTISGCWYMPTKSGKTTYYWSIYLILTLILYSSVCLHASYILRHNMADMMKSIGLAISAYSAMLKIITFMINRGSLIKYHRILDDLFEEELMQNEKIRTIILSPLRTIHTLAYTYFIFLMGLVVAYSSPSYIVAIRGLYHHLIVTNYSLPISRRIGYFWTVPDNYLCHFYLVFETSLGLTSTIVACSVDNVFGFYVYQFISTMRAMTFRLTNPLPTEKFSDLLGKCVAKHQKLLRCRDTLEHVFGHIVFWHVISNAILVCGLMYDAVLRVFVQFWTKGRRPNLGIGWSGMVTIDRIFVRSREACEILCRTSAKRSDVSAGRKALTDGPTENGRAIEHAWRLPPMGAVIDRESGEVDW